MKVRPNDDYQMVSTNIRVNRNLVYEAEPATNQPDWEEKEKIFLTINGFLLEKGEYTIVED